MTYLRRGLLPVLSFLAITATAPAALAQRPDIERPDRRSATPTPAPSPAPTPAPSSAPTPVPDRTGRLEMVPFLGLDIGRDVAFSMDAGAFLSVRLAYGLRVGPSVTAGVSIVEGLEGCSTAKYCLPSRWRAGVRAEYHFVTDAPYRPWLALEIGREQWHATEGYDSGGPRVSFSRTVIGPQGGVDFVARWGRAIAGAGLFAGLNVDNAAHGTVLGLRVVVGGF